MTHKPASRYCVLFQQLLLCKTGRRKNMAFLLHVEFDASSDSTATKMLELLFHMANIIHHDHSETYTYLFRHANQSKTKLIFTEIYANEQVFLEHASDPEFSTLYQKAFNTTAGKSRNELCIRNYIQGFFIEIQLPNEKNIFLLHVKVVIRMFLNN